MSCNHANLSVVHLNTSTGDLRVTCNDCYESVEVPAISLYCMLFSNLRGDALKQAVNVEACAVAYKMLLPSKIHAGDHS